MSKIIVNPRDGDPTCPEGCPEVTNPEAPSEEWKWNLRMYKVYDEDGTVWSYCRACGDQSKPDPRRWFNNHGQWEDEQ